MKWNIKRLSPSSINTYYQCNRKFYFSYIEKLPRKSNKYAVRGLQAHVILENFFKRYERPLEKRMENLYNKFAKRIEYSEFGMEEEEITRFLLDVKLMTGSFLNTFQTRMKILINSKKTLGEQSAFYMLRPKLRELKIYNDKLKLVGIIDTVQTSYDGKTVIGDYKTSKMQTLAPKEDHVRQTKMYALLYYKKEGRFPDYVCLNYLRYGERYYFEVTPSMIYEAEKIVVDLWSDLFKKDRIEDFPLNETKLCSYCDFLDVCMKRRDETGLIKVGKNDTIQIHRDKGRNGGTESRQVHEKETNEGVPTERNKDSVSISHSLRMPEVQQSLLKKED